MRKGRHLFLRRSSCSHGKGFREHEEVELITFEENSGVLREWMDGPAPPKVRKLLSPIREAEKYWRNDIF